MTGAPTIGLELVSIAQNHFYTYNDLKQACVVFECNIAFLWWATNDCLEQMSPEFEIQSSGHKQENWVEPSIRALSLVTRDDEETNTYYAKCVSESESETLCVAFHSGRKPICVREGFTLLKSNGELTWQLTEAEYHEISTISAGILETAEEVPFQDYMCGLGNVPLDSLEVVQWPPPLRCRGKHTPAPQKHNDSVSDMVVPSGGHMSASMKDSPGLANIFESVGEEDQSSDTPDDGF